MLNHIPENDTRFLVAALKALAQPTRLRIFDMLMEGVQCSCEISEELGLAPNLISYHMRALEEAGLVDSERDVQDARWIYYSVRPAALEHLQQLMLERVDPSRIKPREPHCGPVTGCSRTS